MVPRPKTVIRTQLARRGIHISRESAYDDLEPGFWPLRERCARYTMTSIERLYAVHQACRQVARAGIAGDFVECGVWRGGSSMMAALTFMEAGDTSRRLWLYDTFEGMTEPGALDRRVGDGSDPHEKWAAAARGEGSDWCRAPREDVEANMRATGYPAAQVDYVAGKVEETIPAAAPETIAVLRLDTDWYESTRHELEHLWPRLAPGGVLLIDDYGGWAGARTAVDEFFAGTPVLLARSDQTGRVAVKPG